MINFIHKIFWRISILHCRDERIFPHIAVAGTETKPWIEFHPKPPAHSESLHELVPFLAFHFSSAHLSPHHAMYGSPTFAFSTAKNRKYTFYLILPRTLVGAEFFLYFSGFFFGTSKKVFPASQWKIQLSASVWEMEEKTLSTRKILPAENIYVEIRFLSGNFLEFEENLIRS